MALTGANLLERVRRYIDDRVEPYTNPDSLLCEFLTEAERQLALGGRLIRTTMNLKAKEGSAWIDLPETPEIIEFRRAELVENVHRHPLRLQGTMDTRQQQVTDYGQILTINRNTQARPTALVFGRSTNRVEVSPVPDQDYIIEASVIVYPEEPITASTSQVSIPARHEAAVAIGAALLALEADPFFDHNSTKMQTLGAAWQQALLRAAQETDVISREASPVQFSNEYW